MDVGHCTVNTFIHKHPKHLTVPGAWSNGYQGVRLMDSPTFSSTSRSACFGDLHASTSSHIVMSAHHDVYTGGCLLHFASYAAFPSADIHVWLSYLRYSSRRYILHLDTWGLHTFFTSIVHFLTAGSWCVLDILLTLRRKLVGILVKTTHYLTILYPRPSE